MTSEYSLFASDEEVEAVGAVELTVPLRLGEGGEDNLQPITPTPPPSPPAFAKPLTSSSAADGRRLSIAQAAAGKSHAELFKDKVALKRSLTYQTINSVERNYSYESLNEVALKASLTHSWSRKDWPAVKKILFGWGMNWFCYFLMIYVFTLYGCQLFEPRDDPNDPPAGNTDELLISWALSAFQRFVLHEPTLILAGKGLPILFASAFCANVCGESIVNLLSIIFTGIMACIAEMKG